MKKEPNKIGSFLMNADKYVILSLLIEFLY